MLLSGRFGNLMGYCRYMGTCLNDRLKRNTATRSGVLWWGPNQTSLGKEAKTYVCVAFFFFFFTLITTGKPNERDTLSLRRGGFQVLAPKEAPGKTPLVYEQSETMFLLQPGKCEMTFHFYRMFTSEASNLVLNGYSPCVKYECRWVWICVVRVHLCEWCICMCVVDVCECKG